MARKRKRYGWIRDLPDHRDMLYSPPEIPPVLPPVVDMRAKCPPVEDQGDLGSCTANAIAGAMEFDQMKENLPHPFLPSRLFIYYNERVMEGTVDSDSGAQLRDGIKSVVSQGAPPESCWPYIIANFAQEPPAGCYQLAAEHRAVSYRRLGQNLNHFRWCLASGYPFVFGFTVYESFESQEVAQTGHAPMPGPGESVLGGHAVMAVGYDDLNRWFILRNSWGTAWGMGGYFTLPYAYLLEPGLSSDFWTIRTVD